MPRPKSIPNEVLNDLLDQYLNGKSTQWMTDWIQQTNPLRKEPVHTTRSSVQRVVEGLMGEDSSYPLIGAIRTLQRNALRYLHQLEQVDAECEELLEQLVLLPTVEEQRKAQLLLTSRLKVLAMRERILVRKLRLAGVGGARGLEAMRTYESDFAKMTERRRNDPVRNYADWNFQDEPPPGEAQPPAPDPTGEPARNDPSNRRETPVHEGMNRADVPRAAPATPPRVTSETSARNDPSNRPETPVHEGMKRTETSGARAERPAGPARNDASPPPPAAPSPVEPKETPPSWKVRGWGTGK